MKHIRAKIDPVAVKKNQRRATSVVLAADVPAGTSVVLAADVPAGAALCKTVLGFNDSLTDTGLASECDDCRTIAGIATTRDKNWGDKVIGVRTIPEWEPQPMENADEIIASALRNRDGK